MLKLDMMIAYDCCSIMMPFLKSLIQICGEFFVILFNCFLVSCLNKL